MGADYGSPKSPKLTAIGDVQRAQSGSAIGCRGSASPREWFAVEGAEAFRLRFVREAGRPAHCTIGIELDGQRLRLLVMTFDSATGMDIVAVQAQPVIDAFYSAVVTCGRNPPFKPALRIDTTPGAMRYDPATRSVVLSPYETLHPARRAAMDRFAAIGTLGLSGREQYIEVFNTLLVAHELGHWLQVVAQRPLNRWQAEFDANRIMVSFWRDHPAPPPAPPTERRLANFVASAPNAPNPMPDHTDVSVETYFNTHVAEIESNPAAYAWHQKMMVRQAMAEHPAPRFCHVVATVWPT